jgi:hypothetical protein
MNVTLSIVLLVNAVWNFVVWPPFYRRTSRDARAHDAAGKPTRFLRVHAVLIGIALLIGLVSLVFGIIGLIAS